MGGSQCQRYGLGTPAASQRVTGVEAAVGIAAAVGLAIVLELILDDQIATTARRWRAQAGQVERASAVGVDALRCLARRRVGLSAWHISDKERVMPKFLFLASYTTEGAKGVQSAGGSSRPSSARHSRYRR